MRRSTTLPSASSPRCAGCESSRRSTRWRRRVSTSSPLLGSANEQRKRLGAEGVMAYSEKVLDHYSNPRNVGSFAKDEPNVGTGVVGAPECGDVMKLQLKISDDGVVEDARFKTFGCGSAIASSSYVTELARAKIVVDRKSFLYLNGTELDYQDELMSSGFNLRNPNVKRTCGCGSSFVV